MEFQAVERTRFLSLKKENQGQTVLAAVLPDWLIFFLEPDSVNS